MHADPTLENSQTQTHPDSINTRMTMGPNPVLYDSMTVDEINIISKDVNNTRLQKEIQNILQKNPVNEEVEESNGHIQESFENEPIELKVLESSQVEQPRITMDTKAVVAQ